MTIASAIKRLQDLEREHGDAKLISVWPAATGDDWDAVERDLVIAFHTVEGEYACVIMPQDFYETICDLTPKTKPV